MIIKKEGDKIAKHLYFHTPQFLEEINFFQKIKKMFNQYFILLNPFVLFYVFSSITFQLSFFTMKKTQKQKKKKWRERKKKIKKKKY